MRRTWRDSARWLLVSLVIFGGATVPEVASAQRRAPARTGAPVPGARTADRSVATPAARGSAEGARQLADPTAAPGSTPEPFPIGLEIAAATSAPLSLGAEITVELPLGLLVRAHVGFVPEPYVDLLNGVLEGVGAYDAAIAQLVDHAGANALLVRASGGIRPVPGYGFEILAGYTHVSASARVSAADFEAATAQPMSWPGLNDVGLDSELHMLHVQLGWTGLAWDHLAIRVLIGWAHTLSASTRVDVPDDLRARSPAAFADIEADVDDALTSYGFTPELSVAVGYRF